MHGRPSLTGGRIALLALALAVGLFAVEVALLHAIAWACGVTL